MVKDAKNGSYRLILGNIEELENAGLEFMLYKIWVNEEDCEQHEGLEQPWKVAICNNCEGTGTHLKTSLRDIAFSQYDDDYDPDFMDNMRNGCYDQTCEVCDGQGRLIILASTADPKIMEAIQIKIEVDREYRQEVEMERRMGC
jgi:hypothetical protein